MSHIVFLWTANILVWAGIIAYVALLGRQKRQLWRRLVQLESEYDERGHRGA